MLGNVSISEFPRISQVLPSKLSPKTLDPPGEQSAAKLWSKLRVQTDQTRAKKIGQAPVSPSGNKVGRRSEHHRMKTGDNLSPDVIPGFNQSSPQVRFKSEAPRKDLKTDRAKPDLEERQNMAINEEKESEDIVSEPDE